MVRPASKTLSIFSVLGIALFAGCGGQSAQINNSSGNSSTEIQAPPAAVSPSSLTNKSSDFPRPIGTFAPCAVPRSPEEFSDLAGNSSVALTAHVSTPARVVQKLPDTNIIGFPLSDVKIVAGKAADDITEVDFNLVPGATPLEDADYLLFLVPASQAKPPQYFASYGLQGVFLIDGPDVHPLCVDQTKPGTVRVDQSSAPLDSVLKVLADVPLADPESFIG